MASVQNRIWFDGIYKCENLPSGSTNKCISECNDFNTLGNLTHAQTGGVGHSPNSYSGYILQNINTVYNFSDWSGMSNKNDAYLWGIFLYSTKVDGSQAQYIGNANYLLPAGTNYINCYFNGLNKGISFDISSAYASASYALMKTNHLIDLSLVSSVDVSCSSIPLYTLNTDVCSDDSFECLGIDICDSKIQAPVCNCVVYGKDWQNNDVQESFVLDFSNGDVVIDLHNSFASVTSVSLSNPQNSFMGNGVVSCIGGYVQWLSAMWNIFSGVYNCIQVPPDYISCVQQFLLGLEQAIPSLDENVGTFTFDICEEYASFNADLNFFHTSADIIEGGLCQFQNFLWPQLKFVLSAGFEPVITSEECCCDDYDTTVKRGGNGSITITTTTGPEDDDGDGNECVCYWLQEINETLESKLSMIKTSLDNIKASIDALELECNTTVEPCQPSITVEPSVTVTNPVNNVTVEPCSPVVSPTDLSGLISALQTSLSALNSSLSANTDALLCEDSLGNKESIACIIKDGLNCEGDSLACITKKGLIMEDCNNNEITLVETLVATDVNDCQNYKIADVVKDKDLFVDVTIEPYDLVNIRRAFKDDTIVEG